MLAAMLPAGGAAAQEAGAWRLERSTLSLDYGALDRLVSFDRKVLANSLQTTVTDGSWTAGVTLSHLIVRDRIGGEGDFFIEPVRRKLTGFGDMLASVGYRFGDPTYSLGAQFTAKLPTAARELGTGKVDGILQVDGVLVLGQAVAFATIGGRVPGRAAGYDLKNSAFGLLGVQRSWGAYTLGGYGLVRTATSGPVGAQEALVPFGAVKLGPHWQLGAYASIGIGHTHGDLGAGLQLSYAYR